MISRVCEHCGSSFQTYPSRVKRGHGRFCSPHCKDTSRVREVKRAGKHPRICEFCGNTFYTYPAVIERGHARFCSKKCYGAARTTFALTEEHFWSQFDKTGECWIWTGSKTPTGYGKHTVKGVTISTHRLAWMLTHGPIPEEMCVCHHCDVPPCGNPEHLFLGTQQENIWDMFKKKRNPKLPRLSNGRFGPMVLL
jgi:hypothetical protein